MRRFLAITGTYAFLNYVIGLFARVSQRRRKMNKPSKWTVGECMDAVSEAYMIIDACQTIIEKAERRLAQIELEAKLDKPFLALVTNEETD